MKEVVSMFIVNELNEVLLQKRTADYKFPCKWTLFGGSIDEGETPIDAAKREIYEELGIMLSHPELVSEEVVEVFGTRESAHIFKIKLRDLRHASLTEGNGMAFFSLEEIEKMECYPKEVILRLLKA